jgi:hypothetical protein
VQFVQFQYCLLCYNVGHAVHKPLPIRFMSQHTRRSLDLVSRWIRGKILFFIQFKILILTHESDLHVTGFSYRSNTRDAVGRGSHSRADIDVVATASIWILAATASSWASRPEFQHSSPPLGQGYWPLPWAPQPGGQVPPWGMPLWMTPMPQRPSSSPLTVRHVYVHFHSYIRNLSQCRPTL